MIRYPYTSFFVNCFFFNCVAFSPKNFQLKNCSLLTNFWLEFFEVMIFRPVFCPFSPDFTGFIRKKASSYAKLRIEGPQSICCPSCPAYSLTSFGNTLQNTQGQQTLYEPSINNYFRELKNSANRNIASVLLYKCCIFS